MIVGRPKRMNQIIFPMPAIDHDSHPQIMIAAAFLPEPCRPMSGAGFRGRKQRPVMLIYSLEITDFTSATYTKSGVKANKRRILTS
jgi:hypothetical protein